MNVGSRFLGGAASDLSAHLRGMRGRLWVLQLLLLLEGVFCLLVGLAHDALAFTVRKTLGAGLGLKVHKLIRR